MKEVNDLAFPAIDASKPLGTYRVSTIDDYERETRRWLRECMMEISGYPDSSALKMATWDNNSRPEDPVEGVFGFNTDTGQFEYFDGTGWENLSIALPDVYDKARCDQHGNVIDETYATNSDFDEFQTTINNMLDDMGDDISDIESRLTRLKIW